MKDSFRVVDHRVIDQRSLELHQRIALKLRRDPSLVKAVIARLEADTTNSRFSERVRHAYREWFQILRHHTLDELVALLQDPGEVAARLRHSSPFFGILSQEERAKGFRLFDILPMTSEQRREIERLAARYIWWKTVSQSAKMPELVAAQVMNLGDWEDICALSRVVGDDYLRYVVQHAEPGMFDDRAWHYWHYRLRLAELGKVPPLPSRFIPREHVILHAT